MEHQIYIKKAVEILKEGGVVIFPTDTAFGIGCRIDDEDAVAKVFSIRKRPVTQATPVLVSDIEMARELVIDIPPDVDHELLRVYWPGALTVVLPAQLRSVPKLVRGGGITVGVRAPNHEITQQIIKELGIPILGPSANFHGDPTPYSLSEINPMLHNLVDFIVPGVCTVKKESTVIDCSLTPWKIVRQGAITIAK